LITKQTVNSDYKPNLAEFISQCEINYYLLIRVLPFLNIIKNVNLESDIGKEIKFCSESGYQLNFVLAEKARYTTTLLLNLKLPSIITQSEVDLMLRFYHDAKLVEVMDKEGPKALKPFINKNNTKHQHSDEKKQLNKFLGESLKFCINQCKNASIKDEKL